MELLVVFILGMVFGIIVFEGGYFLSDYLLTVIEKKGNDIEFEEKPKWL